MSKIIKADFDGSVVTLNSDGWINATAIADANGKRVGDWVDLPSTREYVERLNTRLSGNLIQAKRGRNGGTWLHPKLAVMFARWISVDFAIWCDEQIDEIIHGKPEANDWEKLRHQAASSYKVMSAILDSRRQLDGKETKHFHYVNEAKLVNWALTGEYKALDRESLSGQDLDLLAKLESLNSVMISDSVSRDDRRERLADAVEKERASHVVQAIGVIGGDV